MTLDRNTLQRIRSGADHMAVETVNPHWIRAYEALSQAADHLDAMIARTEEGVGSAPIPIQEYAGSVSP